MSIPDRKAQWRKRLSKQRQCEPDRSATSTLIADRTLALPPLQRATTVCCYVSFRSEVETGDLIDRLLGANKQVAVPLCGPRELGLFQIRHRRELVPQTLGIPEPAPEIAGNPTRTVPPERVDVFLVPGLGFGPDGKRLGYGRGYYDRLLKQAPSAVLVGLAFDSQIVAGLPTAIHDIPMQFVVTGSRVFSVSSDGCRGA